MLVNYTKRELINNVIMEIKLHQQVPYQIAPIEPLRSFLEALPCTEDKELYDLSLIREPREVKTKSKYPNCGFSTAPRNPPPPFFNLRKG